MPPWNQGREAEGKEGQHRRVGWGAGGGVVSQTLSQASTNENRKKEE